MENMEGQETNPDKDYLTEDVLQVNYEQASQGQRLLNYVIDNLLMRYVISYATGYAIGMLLGKLAPGFLMEVAYGDDFLKSFLFVYLIGIVNYLIYYTLCEKLFRGYTLGKLASGTRVIREDGSELTFKDAFLRSLSRLVPFEAFSGLGQRPWHDSWTNTTVIRAR